MGIGLGRPGERKTRSLIPITHAWKVAASGVVPPKLGCPGPTNRGPPSPRLGFRDARLQTLGFRFSLLDPSSFRCTEYLVHALFLFAVPDANAQPQISTYSVYSSVP